MYIYTIELKAAIEVYLFILFILTQKKKTQLL